MYIFVSSNFVCFSADIGCLSESYFDLEFNTSNDCFYLAEEQLTFYKARETCVQQNMQLASVDSQVCILLTC